MDSAVAIKPLQPTDGEISDSIATKLKPWADPYFRTTITPRVLETIELLRACHFDHFEREAVRHTRDNARELIEIINSLETRLSRARPEIKLRLDQRASDGLNAIRQACELAEIESLKDGRRDQTKEWCAKLAWGLRVRYAAKRPTINSTWEIATLLYQAATGMAAEEEKAALRRACEDHLRRMRIFTKRA